MNALTLSAPRRRDQVVILSAINIGTPSTTLCRAIRRVVRHAISAIAPSGVCTAASVAAGAITTAAALTGHDLTACIAATVGTAAIFFVSPALDARRAKEGGAA